MCRFRWINFYSFLTISYFIVAHCTFTTNLSSKLKSQFQVIFWEDSFLSTWVHFKLVFYCRTLRTFCSLMDGGMPVFTITLLTKKFPISFCKHLVYCKIFLFCQKTVLVVFPDYSFITTKSPILFFICQMVAFEYFQYDLIFDISEQVFAASWSK